jgi:hypothetical protein
MLPESDQTAVEFDTDDDPEVVVAPDPGPAQVPDAEADETTDAAPDEGTEGLCRNNL